MVNLSFAGKIVGPCRSMASDRRMSALWHLTEDILHEVSYPKNRSAHTDWRLWNRLIEFKEQIAFDRPISYGRSSWEK